MVREDIQLNFRPNNSVGREGTEEKGKGREEESREREALSSL